MEDNAVQFETFEDGRRSSAQGPSEEAEGGHQTRQRYVAPGGQARQQEPPSPRFIACCRFIRIHFREHQRCKVLQRSMNAAMHMRKQKE
jgi:hypothetical protein